MERAENRIVREPVAPLVADQRQPQLLELRDVPEDRPLGRAEVRGELAHAARGARREERDHVDQAEVFFMRMGGI